MLLAELERLGLDEDTVVIFTSDNGSRARGEGGSNHPLHGTKGSTWEGGMRVPCIMRWPRRIEEGRVTSVLATAMDLTPTVASIAGAALPPDRVLDGRDITPVLVDHDAASPHEAFFFYRANDLEAVRAGSWKLQLARHGAAVNELYNLHDDIGETSNRFADEPAVVARLTAHADRMRAELGDARLGVVGTGARPRGEVENPRTLTTFDPDHPYFMAEYDLTERG
jgi:arylsulfatase A-like enzyme